MIRRLLRLLNRQREVKVTMIPLSKPIIGKEEKKLVLEVLNSGMLAQGQKVKEFEKNFAHLCGSKHAVAMNSGTAAIHACLYALGVKNNDEVITTPFTFVASANPILMAGANVIFCDIDEETFNISPEQIKSKITENTKAIIAVDLYGQLADYEAIKDVIAGTDIKIIGDASQSVCAAYGENMAGNMADVSAFSFYATKNMTTGEGGMLTTNDDHYAELARRLRHHGQSEQTRYMYFDLGYNYRMTDIQAAIGLGQLDRIQKLTDKRISNAAYLTKGLSKFEFVKTPIIRPGSKHVFHQYTIRIEAAHRDALIKHLKQKGVGCGVYYPKPLHLHPAFEKMGYKQGDFPVSEKMAKEVISLPVHPLLTQQELDTIIAAVGSFNA